MPNQRLKNTFNHSLEYLVGNFAESGLANFVGNLAINFTEAFKEFYFYKPSKEDENYKHLKLSEKRSLLASFEKNHKFAWKFIFAYQHLKLLKKRPLLALFPLYTKSLYPIYLKFTTKFKYYSDEFKKDDIKIGIQLSLEKKFRYNIFSALLAGSETYDELKQKVCSYIL